MNKQTLITLIAIGLIASCVIGIGYTALTFNQSATVNVSGIVVYFLNDVEHENDDPINWGTINPGQTLQKTLDVDNRKNVPVTATITSTLPTDWTQTWSLNNVEVPMLTKSTGTITLTAPLDAEPGTVTFISTINP